MIPLQLDILVSLILGNLFANNTKALDSENLWSNMSRDALAAKNPKLMYINQKHLYNVLIHLLKKAPSNTYRWT